MPSGLTAAPKRIGLVVCTAAALLVPCGDAQQVREGLEVQRGRPEKLKARGAKSYYTKRWNLDDLPPYQPERRVSGTIREWGSNYFGDGNLNKYWEEGFRKHHPEVQFEYHLQTPLAAIPALCFGIADLAPSRPITFDESLHFQRVFSRDPVEITAVTGSLDVPGWSYAIGIFVHERNPISRLTLKQLDGIFGAERNGAYEGTTWRPEAARSAKENIRAWGQLGLTGEWKDRPINVYGFNLRYHIPRLFEKVVFQGGAKWNERLHEYANYRNPDGSTELEAKQVMDALSKDPYGIGYSSVLFLTPQTKAVAVAPREGGAAVELTLETVRDRTYPLVEEVNFYLDREPGKPVDPKVKEFLHYVLSREGQDAVQRDGKYLPLTAEVVREQRKKLE